MAKILKIRDVINPLGGNGHLKWYLDDCDHIVTKIGRHICCPLSAYVLLAHNLYLDECDVSEFVHEYLFMHEDHAEIIMLAADTTADDIQYLTDDVSVLNRTKIKKLRAEMESWLRPGSKPKARVLVGPGITSKVDRVFYLPKDDPEAPEWGDTAGAGVV